MARLLFASRKANHRGFTLLEMLVAITIMGLSVTALYRLMGSSARQTGVSHHAQQAIIVAQGLLVEHAVVPPAGVRQQGQAGALEWRVESQPMPTVDGNTFQLHRLTIEITHNQRSLLSLSSLAPQQLEPR